jgi:tRNA G46 methylase TrmB
MYQDGTYRDRNPGWHSADSEWKARKIAAILDRNQVDFATCAEVGCGAGLVLSNLAAIKPGRKYAGYEVSPDAAALWISIQASNITSATSWTCN